MVEASNKGTSLSFRRYYVLPPQLHLVLEIEFAEAVGPRHRHVVAGDSGGQGAAREQHLVERFEQGAVQRDLGGQHPDALDAEIAGAAGRAHQADGRLRDLPADRQTTDSLGECRNLEYPGPAAHPFNLEGQMQLGALQYPRYPVASSAEFHHFLEIMGGTYDSKIKNMRIVDQFYPNTEFIAAFPTERVP